MPALPASRVEVFEVTLPAGTPKAAPVETDSSFPDGELTRAEILFPDGCAGLVGVRLALAHGQAIPTTAGAWLVGNDETLGYDLTGMPNNGAWSVFGYNLDVYPHTVHVRFLVTDFQYLGASQPGATAPLPILS
jgi:hypothetical protein